MKRHFIATFTILLAVIISAIGMVAFVSYFDTADEGNLAIGGAAVYTSPHSDSVQTAKMDASATKLTPKFYALVNGKEGKIRYDFPNDKLVYSGILNKADYRVEWEEDSNLVVDYSLKYYDKEGNELPEEEGDRKPWKAGTYTIEVVVNDPAYYVEPTQSKCDMTITPFVCHLESVSATTKVYDGLYFNPNIKFRESILPDNKAYKISYYQKVGNSYQAIVGQTINVGEYKVSLEFANDDNNYTYVFVNESDKNWNGTFQITPRQLKVNYNIDGKMWNKPSGVVYSGKAKDIQPMLSGWRYNAATSQNDGEVFDKECLVEITQNGEATTAYRVGKYTLTIKSNVEMINYSLPPADELEIVKKNVNITYKLPADLVYNGVGKNTEIVTQDICEGDDVILTLLYNGEKAAPINAGEYNISIHIAGNDISNYNFSYDDKASMTIAKAEYPTTDFDVVVYSNKIVVTVDKPSQCEEILYSVRADEWLPYNELSVAAMQDYTVQVKLVESANYQEKILSKIVKTGFDSKVFADLLAKVDTDNFSFKDVATYLEIERCYGYVSDTDLANIDSQKLEQVRALYSAYKLNAQGVVQDATNLGRAMSLSVSIAVSSIAGVSVCVGILATRRKRDED